MDANTLMITAAKLYELSHLSPAALTNLIQKAGYKRDHFDTSQFLGLTNGGEFCYVADFFDGDDIVSTKVFARYDAERDQIVLDY